MNSYIICLMIILFVLINICIIRLQRYNDKLAKTMTCLFVVNNIQLLNDYVRYTISNELIIYICYSIMYISFLWFFFLYLNFLQKYTNQGKNWVVHRAVVSVLCIVSTIVIALNPIFKNFMVLNKQIAGDNNFEYYVEYNKVSSILYFVLCGYFVLCSIVTYIYKLINTAKIYRPKYLYPFIVTVCVLLIDNIAKNYTDFNILSSLLYATMTLLFFYFAYIYLPVKIVDKSISFVVAKMNNGIICFDTEDRCVYVNRVIRKRLDTRESLLKIQKYFACALENNIPEDSESYAFEDVINIDGKDRNLYYIYRKMYDDNQNCIGYCFEIEDRTEQVKKYRDERYKANHDMLTGIYNKEHFLATTKKLLDKYKDEVFLMICTDIKDFKLINELFGVVMGDIILCKEAELIKQMVNEKSSYGRISGDKFAICMPKEAFDEEKMVEEFLNLATEYDLSDFKLQMYVGVYEITKDDEKPSVMCDKAFLAIKKICEDYHQIVSYFDNDMMKNTVDEKEIIDSFDAALENKEFCIYIQPQFTKEGIVLGGEALVRWNKPDKGLVPPGLFIPVLEQTSLIARLDCFVWEEAVKQLSEWQNLGLDYHISVNISGKDFFYTDVYEVISNLTKKYNVDNSKLKLEITEAFLVNENLYCKDVISKLQKDGFEIEIDDFGSGYSSINMLKDIIADVIKIDMGFLRKTQNPEKSNIILNSIIKLSHNLDIVVICEGVETKEQLELLNDMGCEQYQGYYFSKPIPKEEFCDTYIYNI